MDPVFRGSSQARAYRRQRYIWILNNKPLSETDHIRSRQRAHIAGRNLSELNSYGEKLLDSDEIRLIKEITGEIWSSYSASAVKLRAESGVFEAG